MAYTTIDKPTDYFEVKLHSGNATSKTLAFDFEVDFYWTKMRNDAYNHLLFDSSRGANKILYADLDAVEASGANTVTFGNASGVTLGTDSSNNGSNKAQTDAGATATYVGYGWKANGGTRTTNTESGDNPGGGYQADTTAGFSIVDFVGTGATGTKAHGLGATPEFILFKNRGDETGGTWDWAVYHHSLGNAYGLYLSSNSAQVGSSSWWNSTSPTSTNLSLHTNGGANEDGENIIAYCWTPIQGYSKFGSYEGNGNDNGPFVYLGFKPAMVIVKGIDGTRSWVIRDNTRSTYNPVAKALFPHSNTSEQDDAGYNIDFLSNGFKVRDDNADLCTDDETYIYMAWAEQPFVSSEGVPCTAR